MLEISDLMMAYSGAARNVRPAVDGVSLHVPEGAFFTLLGPSGCGKTTTLRSVAGLETPARGRIAVAGRVLFDSAAGQNVPANRRGVGMVFQSYAVWPHMTVAQNIEFALKAMTRRVRPGRAERHRRVERVLAAVHLSEFASRPATKLSGGQQQRLALARAISTEPPLLLLDEPLSNLDARLRDDLRLELKRMQTELGITTVCVTHDQTEALAMSTRVAVMNAGRIIQEGAPEDIYNRPADRFVAHFIGGMNFIEGACTDLPRPGLCRVDTRLGSLVATAAEGVAPGCGVQVGVRPEQIAVSEDGAPPAAGVLRVAGQVRARSFLGAAVELSVAAGPVELRVRTHPGVALTEGTLVLLDIMPGHARALLS